MSQVAVADRDDSYIFIFLHTIANQQSFLGSLFLYNVLALMFVGISFLFFEPHHIAMLAPWILVITSSV